MDEWFAKLARSKNPSRQDLVAFVDEVLRLLKHVVENDAAAVLWRQNPELRRMAIKAFPDVAKGAAKLRRAIQDVPEPILVEHGLVGAAARFKYNVMATVSRGWGKLRRHFTIGGGFRRVIEAIDAHLDSLIEATGAGGIIKEFKDALLALAPEK